MKLNIQKSFIRVVLGSALTLAGCATVSESPPNSTETPVGWSEGIDEAFAEANAEIGPTAWGDPVLRDLLFLAEQENRDLVQAGARLDEAVALRGVTRAALFPQVDAEGAMARQRASETGAASANAPPGAFEPWQTVSQAGLNASWEIDLFGYNRARLRAEDAGVEAIAADLAAVRLAILAETTLAYIEMAALNETLTLTRESKGFLEQSLHLVRVRIEAGLEEAVAERSVGRDLRLVEAEVADVEAGLAAARHRLAVLTGSTVEEFDQMMNGAPKLPVPPDLRLPAQTPAEVLRNRPDVRGAERQLAAAYARLGVAEADFYPRLRLTGGVGWETTDGLDNLLSAASRTWLIRPSVHLPLFAGGRIRAQRDGAEAGLAGATAAYEQSVLRALADVETVLAAHLSALRREASLSKAKEDARAVEDRAANLLASGLGDLDTLLSASRLRNSTAALEIQARAATLSQTIRYHKAIGSLEVW